MEAAQLALDGLEQPPEPFRGDCPSCGADVLALELEDGAEVVVDPVEVLEAHACPSCAQVAQRGHRRSSCRRCAGGMIGEPLPLRGVAVDFDAAVPRARLFVGTRAEGEAVYRFHACAV